MVQNNTEVVLSQNNQDRLVDTLLSQSEYDFTSRMFPLDITQNYQGHFMVLNINVQDQSAMATLRNGSQASPLNFTTLENEYSKTDVLRYSLDWNWLNSNNDRMGRNLSDMDSRPRFTKRIKESIALYMPNSEMTFSDAHDYDNISLTKFGSAAISGAGKLIDTAASTMGLQTDFAGTAGAAQAGIGALAQLGGMPVNPKVEVLFANTFQREFTFDFLFSPTSEKEANDLESIIRTIRFHAAPELRNGGAIPFAGQPASFFWVPPSEFDITFYYKDMNGQIQENKHIPRINTCVLKQIDVSYSPTGIYSTFIQGSPVQTRMMLRFTETEVAHKLRIAQGF